MYGKQSSELTSCYKETDKDNFLCQVFGRRAREGHKYMVTGRDELGA